MLKAWVNLAFLSGGSVRAGGQCGDALFEDIGHATVDGKQEHCGLAVAGPGLARGCGRGRGRWRDGSLFSPSRFKLPELPVHIDDEGDEYSLSPAPWQCSQLAAW